jgi:ElaB/YqjD/DUF883 family membrane-anchored ribosome-binding protein
MASTKDATATIEDIQRDVQVLRNDMAKLAAQMTDLLSAGGSEALDGIKQRVRRMQNGLDETVSDVSQRSREALSEVSDQFSEAVQDSLQEHPLATVGLALGLGFLFGTAWRR